MTPAPKKLTPTQLAEENAKLTRELNQFRRAARHQAFNAERVREEMYRNSSVVWRRSYPAILFAFYKFSQMVGGLRVWEHRRKHPGGFNGHLAPFATRIDVSAPRTWRDRIRSVKAGSPILRDLRRRPAKINGVTWFDYDNWARIFDSPNPTDLARLRNEVKSMENLPEITLIVPTYNADERYFKQAIDSIRAQAYTKWRVIVVEDGSGSKVAREHITKLAKRDRRFTYIERSENGGIAEATNTALDAVETPWVAFFDHDDLLPPHALAILALQINDHPEWRMVYTDEDKVDEENRRFHPYFKRDFDPLLLLGQNYITHFVLMQKALIDETGPLDSTTNGAQDWDYVLRATERLSRSEVGHVPHILYHWRAVEGSTALTPSAKPYIAEAGLKTVKRALERRGLKAKVEPTMHAGHFRINYELPEVLPSVDVVIPTRDGELLAQCLLSLRLTGYTNYQVTVIDNGSVKKSTRDTLARHPEVRVVRDARPFNFSALHNAVVGDLNGDYLLLLNDDTEVLTADWLEKMVALAEASKAGVVGAKLLYSNSTIQHAGVVLTPDGAHHILPRMPWDTTHYRGQPINDQEFSAVTGACMLIRRSVFDEVGGFTEDLAVAFNDVDFCLKVRATGASVVYTPDALLRHHESITRGTPQVGFSHRQHVGEVDYMFEHWGDVYANDPYYNPNLDARGQLYELSWPPRVSPWAYVL